jgi:hypothetical protein
MPLTGALQADFSGFVDEANKASAALGVMEGEAKKTGVTMAKTGQVMDGFGDGKGTNNIAQLTAGLRSVDGSMNALGLSIAKPVALIEELGQVSGKTYAQLGLLGSAGVAFGVVVAGMELGKVIADLTNMDETAKNLQSRFLGWNDSADAAANRQAVLALALQRTGIAFTDVNDAMAANSQWVKDHAKEVGTAIHRQAEWEKEIRAHRAELPAMTAAIANHTATVKQLHEQYGISADALTFYIAKTKDQTAAQDEATRKAEQAAAAQQKLKDSMFGGDSITKANEMIAALGGVGNVSRMTTEEQAKLNAAVGEAIETYDRWGQTAPAALDAIYTATASIGTVVTGLGSEFASLGTKFTVSADPIIADTKRMKDEAAAYEAQTQEMAQAWQQVPPPIEAATKETQQLTVAFNQASSAIRMTAAESIKAGQALEDAYREAGIFVGMQMATAGYQQQRRMNAGREITGAGQAWGNTLTVNVNSTDANNIATKLVDEMRRNGVRF